MRNIYRALKEMYSDGTEYIVVARTVFMARILFRCHGMYSDGTE
jgi:hypothetical protein